MISALPAMKMPAWLGEQDAAALLEGPFPLEGILSNSLYYPSSAFDGRPVAHVAGNYLSFIYVDYGVTLDSLTAVLSQPGFRGYKIISQRSVTERELVPHGWTPTPPLTWDGDLDRMKGWVREPFCEWVVLERNADRPESYGPRRFSLLYLCADGVAAFQALYHGNQLVPAAVAIIQPGYAFGGNWTNFIDERRIFARSVMGNPAGRPEVLLWGGAGGRDGYRESCWPEYYSRHLVFLGTTTIGVWTR